MQRLALRQCFNVRTLRFLVLSQKPASWGERDILRQCSASRVLGDLVSPCMNPVAK